MAKEAQTRRKEHEVHSDCLSLLEACVPTFSEGKSVKYSDVEEVLKTSHANSTKFAQDRTKIKSKLDSLRDLLELLGIPLPTVTDDRRGFYIPVRRFAVRISELRREKTRLAESLVAHTVRGKYLVPRIGTVYFGFGATVLAVAESLCKLSQELEGFVISTSNIEVLIRYYVSAPAQRTGHFFLQGCGEINWDEGCIIPDKKESPITTSIISFETMNEQGQFFADTEPKLNALQDALNKTSKKIILVGDRAKFSPGHDQHEILLPANRDVYLFTNAKKPPAGYETQKNVKWICAKTSRLPEAESSLNSAPKRPR